MKMKKIFFLAFCLIFITAAISGATSTPAPKISATPTSVNFGPIALGATSAPKVVTLKNTGTSDLSINTINITGTDSIEFGQTNSCVTIAAGGTCPVNVTFTPALPYAKKTALLTIASSDPKKPTLNVKLSGQVPPPKISATPGSLNFGKLSSGTTISAKSVTIKNTGLSDLLISSIDITGTNPGDFTATNHCGTVKNGGSCTINVVFEPLVPNAKRSATMNILSNDPKKPTVSLKLSGSLSVSKSPAAGITNSSGNVTLTSNGVTIPVQLTDQNTGLPLTGVAVGLGYNPTTPGSAILVMADASQNHPLQFVLLEAASTTSSTAEASSDSTISVPVQSGCPTQSGTTVSAAIKTSHIPPAPEPWALDPDKVGPQFVSAFTGMLGLPASALPPGWLFPAITVTRYSAHATCLTDLENIILGHATPMNTFLAVIEKADPAIIGYLWPLDVVGLSELGLNIIDIYKKGCYYDTGRTVEIEETCVGTYCIEIPVGPAFTPTYYPVALTESPPIPSPPSSVEFINSDTLGLTVVGTTDSNGKATVQVPAGSNTVCINSSGYAQYVQLGFVVSAPGNPLSVTLTSTCTYTLSSPSPFDSTGGTGGVNVTTADGCNWTAISNNPDWITITSGSSGSGNGNVNYTVAANASTDLRTGTMTIAGQTFTVTQAGTASAVLNISAASCTDNGTGNYDYDIAVNWSATGPVGASLQFRTHIEVTSPGVNCIDTGCGSWTAPPTDGDCTRGPNDPATTSGTWCYSAACTAKPCNYNGGADITMVDSNMNSIAYESTGSLICQ